MNKVIVITTIHEPTEAIFKFCDMKDWRVIIVGDLKTPHAKYRNLASNVMYLGPEWQHETYPDLGKAIGWNTSCRRNIGFLKAYEQGADIMAMVDDDNIPTDEWGKTIYVGKPTHMKVYHMKDKSKPFNPFWGTNYNKLWHRGYPMDLATSLSYETVSSATITPLVQADFWDGDPDIDAVERILYSPECKFQSEYFPFASSSISPFNSQNTFLDRTIIPHYMLFPGIGRVDDIWGAYALQLNNESKLPFVVYGAPTVVQKRNEHDIYNDMELEMYGAKNVRKFLDRTLTLPNISINAHFAYRNEFMKLGVEYD